MKPEPDIELADAATPVIETAPHPSGGGKLNALLEGAGLALLYILPFAATFLSPSLGDAYHSIQPIASVYRALLIVTFVVWLFAALAFALVRRLPERWQRVAWMVSFVVLPWLICRAFVAVYWYGIGALAMRAAHILPTLAVAIGVALLLFRPGVLDRCLSVCRLIYTLAACGMLVVLPQLVYHAWDLRPLEPASFVRGDLPPIASSEPRIVWILMDELSYDQVFGHRQSGVSLPNFDSLAKSSAVFSDLQPFGNATEELLPGLLLGKALVALRMPYGKPPSYRTSSDRSWQQFDQNGTIFADARALGWTTGLAGWYNPYCRLLPDVLNRCFWQFSGQSRNTLSSSLKTTNTVLENIYGMLPFRQTLDTLLHRPILDRTQPYRQDYVSVMAQAEDIVHDSRIRFAFVHLSVPHPPGIYDRVQHVLRENGTYLDNLVLADDSLGRLESIIQSTPAAANTVLIVSSDHSWRTFMWRNTPDWSDEGERATGGHFDPRPVLIVHLPGSTTGQTIARPTGELVVHGILQEILRGKLHSAADLERVVQQPAGGETAE